MISGLSRGNRPVIRNGLVRRRLRLPTGGSWGVQNVATTGLGDVLSIDSAEFLKLGNAANAALVKGTLGPLDITRQSTPTGVYASVGHNGTRAGMGTTSTGGYYWSNLSTNAGFATNINGAIVCENPGIIQLGEDASSSIVNQTLKACDGTGADKPAADLTIAAGRCTGAGTEGNLILQTAAASGTSSTANTLTTRLTVNSVTVSAAVPLKLSSYTVAGVPSAATAGAGALIWVSNESGGACPACSDGTNWKKVALGATIS